VRLPGGTVLAVDQPETAMVAGLGAGSSVRLAWQQELAAPLEG
jgi:hypothetical protein